MNKGLVIFIVVLVGLNLCLYFLNENERRETELAGYRYDRDELIKSRVKLYYLDKKYRTLVKEYSRCKNK